jgi:hypothetical protein
MLVSIHSPLLLPAWFTHHGLLFIKFLYTAWRHDRAAEPFYNFSAEFLSYPQRTLYFRPRTSAILFPHESIPATLFSAFLCASEDITIKIKVSNMNMSSARINIYWYWPSQRKAVQCWLWRVDSCASRLIIGQFNFTTLDRKLVSGSILNHIGAAHL